MLTQGAARWFSDDPRLGETSSSPPNASPPSGRKTGMTKPIHFLVEHAGCESCAARVRSALAGLLAIEEITVDERADVAGVRAQAPPGLELASIDAALGEASRGSGHTYRVRPDSWRSSS
jgi:hypothetical protein